MPAAAEVLESEPAPVTVAAEEPVLEAVAAMEAPLVPELVPEQAVATAAGRVPAAGAAAAGAAAGLSEGVTADMTAVKNLVAVDVADQLQEGVVPAGKDLDTILLHNYFQHIINTEQ